MTIQQKIAAMNAELERYCKLVNPTWEQYKEHVSNMAAIDAA